MVKSPPIGIAFALGCLVILGVMPLLSNTRPAGSDGLVFALCVTAWQLIAALPLSVAEFVRGRRVRLVAADPAGRKRIAAIALATGAMFGVTTYLYVAAAQRAGAVSLGIALQAYPLFAMLLEAVFLGKRKSAREIGLTVLMVAALVYLITGGTFRPATISWWSVLALGIPLLWSIAHLLLKPVLERASITPNQVTVSRLLISGACLLLFQAGFGTGGALTAALTDLDVQKAAALLGIAYYVELVLWFYAMRHIDVSLASSVTVPAPAVTMLVAVALLGQEVQRYQLLAMAVVTASLYGLLLGQKRARRLAPAG